MKKLIQKGFTLIELMIVVAILAILIAIVLPRFIDLRDSSSAIKNDTQLEQTMDVKETKESEDKTL